jgi:hypothetical protein
MLESAPRNATTNVEFKCHPGLGLDNLSNYSNSTYIRIGQEWYWAMHFVENSQARVDV